MIESWSMTLISVLLSLLIILIGYVKYKYGYWARKGVLHIKPSFPFGNMKDVVLQRVSIGDHLINQYKQLKTSPEISFAGGYNLLKPELIVLEPELARIIMARDFQNFQNRPSYCEEEYEPLMAHLFNLRETQWRTMRRKLTPTFTSGKMKMMFQTLLDCSDELEVILQEYSSKKLDIDIKELMGRFTTDIIGSCAFGLECNSLKNPDAEFRRCGKQIFELSAFKSFQFFLSNFFPGLFKFLRFKRLSLDLTEFFVNSIEKTVEYREKNNITRKDFLQLLIQMKKDGNLKDDEGLTILQIAAQCFVFFLAGFETSSSTMTYFMYEVTRRPDIQDKCRDEINKSIEEHDGKLTYEGIMEMQYLEKVIYESMRLHPPLPFIFRQCTQKYQIPETDVVIEKGTSVWIPSGAFHTNPDIFPDPTKFDPERFSTEEKAKRHPYSFLPFGEGPRNCIGSRFGLMQTKVGLAVILRNHRFCFSQKTKVPLVHDPKLPINTAQGGIWLQAEKI